MRALALTLALLAGPVAAERMTLGNCIAGLEALAERSNAALDATVRRLRQGVTGDGWCEMRGTQPGIEELGFDRLLWRAEGIDGFIAEGTPPMALSVRVLGLRPDDAPVGAVFDASLVLRQVPEARQLLVEELRVTSSLGDEVHITAVFDRVDVSTWSMAQVSLGSLLLTRVILRAELEPILARALWSELSVEFKGDPGAARAAVERGLDALPDTLLAPGADAQILAFVDDMPSPRGELEIGLSADPGLGVLQFVLYGQSLYAALGQAPVPALQGVTIDVIWAPE
ncbi:MAG: BMC domain [Rhodobacteraceae bacterium HLUCCA08]|nr:MAG: BMC domain [Rhodobacteraceae bacterium HLUCCA08]